MNISFSEQAESDLSDIHEYIAGYNPDKADEYISRILQSIRILENFPLLGRPGRVEDTREWSLTGLPYIAVYHIKSETDLEVLTIIHERRQFP